MNHISNTHFLKIMNKSCYPNYYFQEKDKGLDDKVLTFLRVLFSK